MQGLGADYNVSLNTPFGRVGSTLSIPVEQAARDAVNAAWPPLKSKLEAEVPVLIGQVWPLLQRNIEAEAPKLVKQLSPALQAEMPKLIGGLLPQLEAELPKLLKLAQPMIDAQRKAVMRDVQRTALGLGAALGGVILIAAMIARR